MNGRFVFRILLAIVLVGILVSLGVFIYNAGVSQGLAASGTVPAPGGEVQPSPYYWAPFYRPWGFGFFPFGFIFPLFFGLLIIWAISGLFFRGRRHWGWRSHEPGEVPPMLEEWHRKLHADRPEGSGR